MEIRYKVWIQHGNAKLSGEKIILTIPLALKGDQAFLQKMLTLWAKLEAKIAKKNQIACFDKNGVLLFGERVGYQELPTLSGEKQWHQFLCDELRAYAEPLLEEYAQQLGFRDVSLTIRKVRSKRGSCSRDNRIMLNRDLVHLPTKLIQYIIQHEVCHLVHKHHQKAFWELVVHFAPEYRQLRAELKRYHLTNQSLPC